MLQVASIEVCKVRVYVDVSVMRFGIDYKLDQEASNGFIENFRRGLAWRRILECRSCWFSWSLQGGEGVC